MKSAKYVKEFVQAQGEPAEITVVLMSGVEVRGWLTSLTCAIMKDVVVLQDGRDTTKCVACLDDDQIAGVKFH